jgi:hypothetical protein
MTVGRHQEQRRSAAMKRFIGIVIVAMTIGAPASAQFDPDNETGNLVAAVRAPVHSRALSRHLGEEAYAMSPRWKVNHNAEYSNNDNTGGGSAGYNEMLLKW